MLSTASDENAQVVHEEMLPLGDPPFFPSLTLLRRGHDAFEVGGQAPLGLP